jgi:hypothetical protein
VIGHGTTDNGYTGTIFFSSSDGQAILPPSYTFTAQDAGVHTFSATLKTAGTQSITVTDDTGLTATDGGITVKPAAAGKMLVYGFPAGVTAGGTGTFTVLLEDPYGNVATGYAGMVHFTSSDVRAVLPTDYTFTSNDAGEHFFSATLKTAGTQSITATDGSFSGTDSPITVNPAAASQFVITAPASVDTGASFSLTVKVEDAYGNVITGYRGTVRFTSTDGTAKLPRNYTFTAADRGVHTFTGLVLRQAGNQTITLTDTLDTALSDSVIIDVLTSKKGKG